ncbi:MAG: preprotein translocase subunit SecY [Clostridiales bacterium]|nr:preprotein translocase subunit SecY [Clostridiales bacterium]
MFNTLKTAFKVKEIRMKIFYMLAVLLIIRFGTYIPVPGIDVTALAEADVNTTLYAYIAGGSYGTIFAMGIGPYITASIIMQLLTVAIPKLEQINKEGEEGRKKINKWTRYLALGLAVLQGCGQIYSVHGLFLSQYQNFFVYFVALVSMVTGTIFVMWLGELLTEAGIGNGSSFIIFANILDKADGAVTTLVTYVSGQSLMYWVGLIILIVLFLALVVLVILVQDGERRIPVQYTKKMVGRRYVGGQSSYIPIKVNIAGVMAIIFAVSLLQFPQTIYQFFPSSTILGRIVSILELQNPVGCILYMILIFCFTFFYTSFAFNSVEVADNMKKAGGLVPGVRPGKPTADYIQGIVDRMSLIGACFYAVIAFAPIAMQWIFKINVSFGGTTLLIVSGVALELINQLEAQLVMRNYKGFLS